MRRHVFLGFVLSLLTLAPSSFGACAYFAAKDKDITQPAQKAFITFDIARKEESFTVQPRFTGNAVDFGMVIPTPARPKLDEMPRDFFGELAVFTILEPMDLTKYKITGARRGGGRGGAGGFGGAGGGRGGRSSVVVLEAGVVGSLDYKIISAEQADDLFQWLKDNNYSFSGDESTLDFYIKKKWIFTTMKIDPKQMKTRPDGTYDGQITPTRFTFESAKLIYPLKITQTSVKTTTEALLYIQTQTKVDLPGDMSYQYVFTPMWTQALSYAIPEKVTPEERAWNDNVGTLATEYRQQTQRMRQQQHQPASLEWAKKITQDDLDVLAGTRRYNRTAPADEVEKLKLLRGHVAQGQFITKIRKVFAKDEMIDDLVFVNAQINDKLDTIEYYSILPTSPP